MLTPISRTVLAVALALTIAASVEASIVTVAWDANNEPDVVGYVVSWGTQHGAYSASLTVGAVTTAQVPYLQQGGTYYLAVQAVNSAGMVSPYSDEVTFTIPETNSAAVREDFAGVGHSTPAIFRCATGEWYMDGVPGPVVWGRCGDVPVPADYDGDGRSDVAVWRPENGIWYILKSSDEYRYASASFVQWGDRSQGDVPVVGDYDGDGSADLAIYRRADGTWYILNSTDRRDYAKAWVIQWGSDANGDVPVPGDYDGDGRNDLAVWRPFSGTWHLLPSKQNYEYSAATSTQWGRQGDIPVPGDYNGDKKADPAIWRPGTGEWWLQMTDAAGHTFSNSVVWGAGQMRDVPAQNDYDGDGKTDIAIWRPSTGEWWTLPSTVSYSTVRQWGAGSWGDRALTVNVWPY